MTHRGTDPEAIKVAESLGLLFDGVQPDFDLLGGVLTDDDLYQFTIASDPGAGITFYVQELDQTETRRDEKLREFGLERV